MDCRSPALGLALVFPVRATYMTPATASFSNRDDVRRTAFLVTAVVVLMTLVSPLSAQFIGMPVWNSPQGGDVFTVSGDYSRPDSRYGDGSASGARASRGYGLVTVTLGFSGWRPEAPGQRFRSYGGGAALRLTGGSALPIAVNLQAGVAHADSFTTRSSQTTVTGALGVSAPLSKGRLSIEPYVTPGIRYRDVNGARIGYAVGTNVHVGLIGLHIAYDTERLRGGGSVGVFGIGADLVFRRPQRSPAVNSSRRL